MLIQAQAGKRPITVYADTGLGWEAHHRVSADIVSGWEVPIHVTSLY